MSTDQNQSWQQRIEDMNLEEMKERRDALYQKQDDSGLTDDEDEELDELEDRIESIEPSEDYDPEEADIDN